MIIYLVKSTILLALLLGMYKLFLENEKMHTFNRFFLLAALVLGLTAPLVQINISPFTKVAGVEISKVESTVNAPSEFVAKTLEPVINSQPVAPEVATESIETAPSIRPDEPMFSRKEILVGVYALVTLFFFIRFGAGLFELYSKVRQGARHPFKASTLVLLDEAITPQSFFRWIFLNKSDFESDKINPEILEHELTHIRQKHSLDVLFIELIKTIFWFNPVFYFYKHAIQLNHEFLADDSVLVHGGNAESYQKILINACNSGQESVTISSKFNQQKITRRASMITKPKSSTGEVFKLSIILPAVLTLCIIFSADVESQTSKEILAEETSAPSSSASNSPVFTQYHPHALNSDLLSGELKDSPYVPDFEDRLETYNKVFDLYKSGTKNKRDVLYHRTRLVWLHQRLTPAEQKIRTVPNLPEGFLNNIELTPEEELFQKQLSSYNNLRSGYSEIPTDKDDRLYTTYEELKVAYEALPLRSRLFIVGNLPPDINFFYMEKNLEEKFDKNFPNPFQLSFSKEDSSLPMHYLNKDGNVVTKTLGELTVSEKDYLKNNAKKSLVTQVYPLPIEENPSEEDFEKWQDKSLYKILLDKKLVDNNYLNNIDPASIHHVEIFEVPWNKNKRLPYDFEIRLYTYEAFQVIVEKYRPSQGMAPFHSAILVD